MRLDVQMLEQGLVQSREKARALIMAGKVTVNGKPADKPGMNIPDQSVVQVAEDSIPFVSRGGLKLQKAVDVFHIDLSDIVAADIGASTGGFTDCMLQHDAKKVYAVDVGYGQLDWRLRNDTRVVVMERTNARNMLLDWFEEPLGFASIDVSFISLQLILPPLYQCLSAGAQVVALIKPQFEAGRAQVGKNGVVRDIEVHFSVCESILNCASLLGYDIKGLSYSPVTGPKGNIEFLALLQKRLPNMEPVSLPAASIRSVVEEAHSFLDR